MANAAAILCQGRYNGSPWRKTLQKKLTQFFSDFYEVSFVMIVRREAIL